jgi:hypothetical protein
MLIWLALLAAAEAALAAALKNWPGWVVLAAIAFLFAVAMGWVL